MSRFDITKTNVAVERLIETTDQPPPPLSLHAYNRHRYLEMAGRLEEIFAPEMTVEKPVYHFNMYGNVLTLEGAEAVKRCTGSGPAADKMSSTPTTRSSRSATTWSSRHRHVPADPGQHPGRRRRARRSQRHLPDQICRTHDLALRRRGRLIGEDVWEYDETVREIIPLDPTDVLTVEQAAGLLARSSSHSRRITRSPADSRGLMEPADPQRRTNVMPMTQFDGRGDKFGEFLQRGGPFSPGGKGSKFSRR